jgi:hypothetical protein
MKINDLKQILAQDPKAHVQFVLPDGALVPAHAHVTEAARIDKRFVDCGGTFREDALCRLQTWVADDLEHRLTAGKLLKILDKAKPVLLSEELEIDVEHELEYISQFPLQDASISEGVVALRLGVRHTACLALDQCCPKPPEILSLSRPALPNFFEPFNSEKTLARCGSDDSATGAKKGSSTCCQ